MRTLIVKLFILTVLSAVAFQLRGERAVLTGAELQVQPELLASPAGPGSAEPNLDIGEDGRVHMSWLEPTDSGHALRFAVHDGARWTEPRTIAARSDFFVNWADFPSLRTLGGGRLAAHWLQRNGTGPYAYTVQVALSRDGGRTWGTAIMPHRDSSQQEHGFVATWRETEALGIVWLDGRKFNPGTAGSVREMTLMSTSVNADGSLGPEIQLDDRTCDCCQNSAAMTAQGPVVVYRDRSSAEIRDIHVTRRVGERWTRGVPVHSDNWRINACPVNGPAVAASGNRVAVAWFTAANDTPRVKVAFSGDAGASFGAPFQVDGGDPVGRVDVALLADGAALVTWIERKGDSAAIQIRNVSANGRVRPPLTITSSSAARASGFPRMVLAQAHAYFAWTQPGRPSSVHVARIPLSALRQVP